MFIFSVLPFSTSDTVYRNGETFEFVLNINRATQIPTSILSEIEFTLNIEQNQTILL